MSLPLYWAPAARVRGAQSGCVVELSGDEGRHAVLVARQRVGEGILVGDGAGTVLTCVVVQTAGRDSLSARVVAATTHPWPDPAITVVQALPKGDRGELAVELLTEVGVDRIVPWQAARCVTRWQPERAARGRQRWEAVAAAAAKQSRRAWIPAVSDVASTPHLLARVGAATTLVLHEEATTALPAVDLPATGELVVVVGPEGGISEAELRALEQAGAVAVRMGGGIMRTSTAGTAAAAVLMAAVGRW